jgi:hypothetical protein
MIRARPAGSPSGPEACGRLAVALAGLEPEFARLRRSVR